MVILTFTDASIGKDHAEYEKAITVALKTLKDIYEPGEAVPLVLTVSNHGSKPVYSIISESDYLSGFAFVSDANEMLVGHDPIPDPNTPVPSYYYMKKGGKKVFTVPAYEIPGASVRTLRIADALRLHHKHISEGTYSLSLGYVELLHDAESSIIVREGLPFRLWIEPRAPLATKVRHKLNTVKIQIKESKTKEPEPFASGWLYLLGAAPIGATVVGILLLLKRRASKQPK